MASPISATPDEPVRASGQPPERYSSLAQATAISLMRVADLVRNRFADVLRPFDISLQQYNVLRILRGAGPAGLPAMQVRERLMEKTPGITRLIDGLEKRGYVERERSVTDRRVVHNRITNDGLQLLAELDAPIDEADEDVVSALDEESQRRLLAELRKMLGAPYPQIGLGGPKKSSE